MTEQGMVRRCGGLQNPVVIYHDNCADGIAAAWVCRRRWPTCELVPMNYSDDPEYERFAGADVLFVDFSWKRPQLEELARHSKSVTVLDHHKTAEAELAGLTGAFFDMEQSGCGLAWAALFPEETMPVALMYIQDRDLWRFELEGSRAFGAWLASEELTLETIQRATQSSDEASRLRAFGTVILRYQARLIASATEHCPRSAIGGYDVPCMPMPCPQLISETGHVLCKGEPFSATWRDVGAKRIYSLRSDAHGLDVAEIAMTLGGGGHKHAAGFTVEKKTDDD
jgi:oligoribonuclease NrnB/cAMP/cGMP phosphodiesterase (DHH superfamily)